LVFSPLSYSFSPLPLSPICLFRRFPFLFRLFSQVSRLRAQLASLLELPLRGRGASKGGGGEARRGRKAGK